MGQSRIHCNQTILINGDGEATRDFVYVLDVVRAKIWSIKYGSGFQVYNVGTETSTSINELAVERMNIFGATVGISYKICK